MTRLAQQRWSVLAIVVAGIAIRIVFLPTPGFVGDIDQFVNWVGHIARNGLGHAYDTQISFGPVMVVIWWVLGLLDPAIVTAGTSDGVAVRIVMKLPAVAADFAIAGAAWWALRMHRKWALAALALVLLHPAIWFESAWWGTYDSVYAAFGVAAFVLAIRNRDALAVVALVLAVMTKPQAAPLAVPFAAWFIARAGWRRGDGVAAARALGRLALVAAVGVVALVTLWLPFVAANGPTNYVVGLGRYQGENYALLSISAWNPWWVLQEVVGKGQYILDEAPLVGGVSFRLAGYLLTLSSLGTIAFFLARRPTPRMLALAVAASVLAAFEFLTTMHERYAFAVLPMLAFVIDDRRYRWFVGIFGTVITLNLVSAVHQYVGEIVPFQGPITVAGSAVNLAAALFLLAEVIRGSSQPEPAAVINEGASGTDASSPASTSAGSAGATSGA